MSNEQIPPEVKEKISSKAIELANEKRYSPNTFYQDLANVGQLGGEFGYLISADQLKKKDEEINNYKEVVEDNRRLVKEIDIIINGKNAAERPSLCDIVSQLRTGKIEISRLKEALATILYRVGHNNDCLFCGFKDKVATEALSSLPEKQEEDQEEMWNEAAEILFKHHNPDLDINSVAGQVTLKGFYKDTNRLKSKYIIHSKINL